jgi:hypothetical protein
LGKLQREHTGSDMRNINSRLLFTSVLILDSVLSVSAILIGQWVTLGFDPIFYNPVLIAAVALVFSVIESYLPFLALYKFLFEIVLRKAQRVRPGVLCWVLFVPLNILSLCVVFLSFGGRPDAIDVLIPVGLNVVNVAVFFQRRVWMSRTRMTTP